MWRMVTWGMHGKNAVKRQREKAPVLKDGENWENFYKCLFDNNDKRAIASQEGTNTNKIERVSGSSAEQRDMFQRTRICS